MTGLKACKLYNILLAAPVFLLCFSFSINKAASQTSIDPTTVETRIGALEASLKSTIENYNRQKLENSQLTAEISLLKNELEQFSTLNASSKKSIELLREELNNYKTNSNANTQSLIMSLGEIITSAQFAVAGLAILISAFAFLASWPLINWLRNTIRFEVTDQIKLHSNNYANDIGIHVANTVGESQRAIWVRDSILQCYIRNSLGSDEIASAHLAVQEILVDFCSPVSAIRNEALERIDKELPNLPLWEQVRPKMVELLKSVHPLGYFSDIQLVTISRLITAWGQSSKV